MSNVPSRLPSTPTEQASLANRGQTVYLDMLPDGKEKEQLKALYERTPVELTSIYEEIAVIKFAAGQAVEKLVTANNPRDRAMAREEVNQMFATLTKMAESATRIDRNNQASASLHMTRVIITELMKVLQFHLRQWLIPAEVFEDIEKEMYWTFSVENDPYAVQSKRSPNSTPGGGAAKLAQIMDVVTVGEAAAEPKTTIVVEKE